jgi:hypothetical protein
MSLIPYKYDVNSNSSILIIPAFPGAYIYNRGIDSSPTALPVPIYMSNPVAGADFSFMNDADYMLLVLPGFKIVIYDTINFGFTICYEQGTIPLKQKKVKMNKLIYR